MDRRRFKNLEWARPERRHPQGNEEDPLTAARLEKVEMEEAGYTGGRAEAEGRSIQIDGAPANAVQTGLARERFEEPAVPLAPVAPDEPLFHRCHVCGADNQRSDEVCQHCNASLLGAAQEAFEAKLRERERDEQRQEREREYAREHPPAAIGDAARQAELGKAFSELFASERGDGRPLAWRLLLMLPGPWRWAGAALVPLCYYWLYRSTERTNGWVWTWLMVGFVSLILFTPPRFWTQTVDRDRWF